MKKGTRRPEDKAFDEAVGARIKAARLAAGISQQVVAREAGVTFQQLQKYERGANRVAASRLAAISRAVGLPPYRLLQDEIIDHSDLDSWMQRYEPEVRELVLRFRSCSPNDRALLRNLADRLAAAR